MKELFVVFLALAALFFAAWQRLETRRTLRRLEEMLSQAISGTFAAEQFDESQLSAIEGRSPSWPTAPSASRMAASSRGKGAGP